MSTKTLRKRIALVAVSAMGFGLVTSVSANAATLVDNTDASLGLVGPVAGANLLAQTATILSTGKLHIVTTDDATIVVSSGGAISSGTNVNAKQTCTYKADVETADIVPTGSAGSTFSVSIYAGGDCTTPGTLNDVINVTIASSSNAGTPSAANSSLAWVGDANDSETSDIANENSTTRGTALWAHLTLKDVYSAVISDTTGALTAEVSSGAVVAINARNGAVVGTYTTAANAATLDDVGFLGQAWINIKEKTAGAGWSGTLKVYYNGVLIATKSGSISGDVSKITLSTDKVGKSGDTTVNAIRYQAFDAAGNILVVDKDDLNLSSSSNDSVVTAVDGTGGADNAVSPATAGKLRVTCGITGTSDVVLYYVNAAGSIVKSGSTSVACGGDAYTYTASFDKASYVQGEIATLTIAFVDSTGKAANSKTAVSADPENITISAPMLKQVETDAASATLNKSGNLVYTFTVGDGATSFAPGSYAAVISLPTVATADPVTAKYAVTAVNTGAITNAEVLSAIVKLIASINKQITALQKLLTKKK